MQSLSALLPLLIIVAGFLLRLHPFLIVLSGMTACAAVAGWDLVHLLDQVGTLFANQRYLLIGLLVLPLVGLLESRGLREHAARWIRGRRLQAGQLLALYLAGRQATAAVGLVTLGGHPQTVRPLLVPMVLALKPGATDAEQMRLKSLSAATDNVALFFGEDVFFAFGAVLLMQGFLQGLGYPLDPVTIALWGLPTAICALLIHGWRVLRLDHIPSAEPR